MRWTALCVRISVTLSWGRKPAGPG
jgi:hypothetical protein